MIVRLCLRLALTCVRNNRHQCQASFNYDTSSTLARAVPVRARVTAVLSKQKDHPDCSAVVFKLLSGCPLHGAQYLRTIQPVRLVWRAHLLPFPISANLAFLQGPSARRA